MTDEPNTATLEEKIASGAELTEAEKAEVMGAPADTPVKEDAEDTEQDTGEEETPNTGLKKEEESEAEEKTEDEEKPEDSPSEKTDEPDTSDKKSETDEDFKKRLDTELDKDPGDENLDDFTPRERAYFFEVRRERRKRQEKQRELDLLKFKDLQKQAQETEKADEADAEEDPFKERDDDEFMTISDVKKILAKQTPKKPTEENKLIERHQQVILENWMLEGQLKCGDDFRDVVSMAETILAGDKDADEEIRTVASSGKNAAITAYNLIKASPKYEEIRKKRASKEAEAKSNEERADRIEKNSKKPKTTGHGGGGAIPPGEYTFDEIVNMSDEDYAKLSPKKREKILRRLEGLE